MPNGIQIRECGWCRRVGPCEPWGDPAEWHCWTCSRWYEIDALIHDLRRVLYRLHVPHLSARPLARVLDNYEVAFITMDFLEDSLDIMDFVE